MKIIIATIRDWNLKNAIKFKSQYKNHEIIIINDHKDLTYNEISSFQPNYIFFPHWSWIIPLEIYREFNCIVFHMTDLPFGRGGSPLQNLILNKIQSTKISAIKVVKDIDAGDVYLKKDLFIGSGSAKKIFINMSKIIFFDMIPEILSEKYKLIKQEGEITTFKRRKPKESNLTNNQFKTLADIYDFIRMLDADGYPKAFIELNHFFVNFSKIKKNGNILKGNFTIKYRNEY
jgi:methionyl-tRNA formyltransferase